MRYMEKVYSLIRGARSPFVTRSLVVFIWLNLGYERIIFAQSFDKLTPNRWYFVSPQWQFLPRFQGVFQARGWGSFMPGNDGKILFFEGFYNTTVGSSIYANALYQYDVVLNKIAMLYLSNWKVVHRDDGSYSTVPLAENQINPTPIDRHTYNQICHVPSEKKVYLFSGANQTGPSGHPKDFWIYSLETNKWQQFIGWIPPFPSWDCACEKNLLYNPDRHELLLTWYNTSKVYTFNLILKEWREVQTIGVENTIGSKGVYDPARQRFLFYGSNWVANESRETNDFVAYYPHRKRWEKIEALGPNPGPRSYAPLTYISKYDVIVLHGGSRKNDTWIYQPLRNTWQLLPTNTDLPTPNFNVYFDYDVKNNVLVKFYSGKIWIMRYEEEKTSVNDTRATPTRLSLSAHPNPSIQNVRIEFSSQQPEPAEIVIYDLKGSQIKRLTPKAEGYSYEWNGLDLNTRRVPAGIYFIEARQGHQRVVTKVVVLR